MDRRKLKSTLETSTNIAVLLVAVAALSTFAINFVLKSPSPNLRAGLERGKLFGPIPKIDYHGSKQTLLIALNTKCSYCQESLPFYQKLVEANHQSNKDLQIVALFPNKAEEVTKFVRENNFRVDAIAEVEFGSLTINGTPSIILLNNKGEINDFWVGKLGDNEVDHLIRSLTSESVY